MLAPLAALAQDASDVIGAVASLAWPLLIVVVLVLFRGELRALIGRIESLKGMGVEVTTRELDVLGSKVDKAAESVAGPDDQVPEPADADDERQKVLAVAGESPKVALMRVAERLERKSREILASSSDPEAWEHRSLEHKLRRLDLNPFLRAAALEFQHIRNKIVHGGDATDEQALRAVDYGLGILAALDRIPHEIHYVKQARVELYADAEAKTPVAGFHGVMLESIGTESTSTIRVFPTTRDHFREGMAVAWEWTHASFPEAWYVDPDTRTIIKAYDYSAEFVGRALDAHS